MPVTLTRTLKTSSGTHDHVSASSIFVIVIYYYYFVYRYPILLSDNIGRAHAEYRWECVIIHVIKYVIDVRFTLFTCRLFPCVASWRFPTIMKNSLLPFYSRTTLSNGCFPYPSKLVMHVNITIFNTLYTCSVLPVPSERPGHVFHASNIHRDLSASTTAHCHVAVRLPPPPPDVEIGINHRCCYLFFSVC